MSNLLQSADLVAQEIASRMARITVALGAETDIGTTVFRGRRKIDDEMIPCSVLIEGEDAPHGTAGRTVTIDQRVVQRYVLIGYAKCDADNPNDVAHRIIRDLKRSIFRTNGIGSRNLGGTVKDVSYRGRDIGPRADGVAIVMAIIEIDVDYNEDLANP
jgi:hypothetical protein